MHSIIIASLYYCADSPTMYRWMVSLDSMEEGGPHVITAIAGNVSITLNDVLFGDVWICSGQSNMQFTVSSVSSFAMYSYIYIVTVVS